LLKTIPANRAGASQKTIRFHQPIGGKIRQLAVPGLPDDPHIMDGRISPPKGDTGVVCGTLLKPVKVSSEEFGLPRGVAVR
jgi:hypothetical protein